MADKEEDEHSNHDEEMSEEATVVQDETGEIEMPEGGQELGQMEEKKLSIYTKLARFTQLLLASLLYCYVLVMIALRYVIPASLGPLLQHWADQVPAQPYRNASNAEAYKLAVSLVWDSVLLSLFVAQHTLMAHCKISDWLSKFNMAAHTRALYVFSTCLVTDVIYRLWRPLMDYQVWHCSGECTVILLILSAVHLLSWMSMICSIFALDYTELLGIKQLYYSYKGFFDPMAYKSMEQRELLRNMRHPIFLAPMAILWLVPTMSYDRLLIATLAPLYLAWGSRLTFFDADYVQYQHAQKGIHLAKED